MDEEAIARAGLNNQRKQTVTIIIQDLFTGERFDDKGMQVYVHAAADI
jgi:hypothetical protein